MILADMNGFTPLTERLGCQETFSLLDLVFEILIHKVNESEGTVNELRGDGILELFGSPIAMEDGPHRAIRAPLDIHPAMTRFNDKIKGDEPISRGRLRIHINSGLVVPGTFGNGLRVFFTALGDTINMAGWSNWRCREPRM